MASDCEPVPGTERRECNGTIEALGARNQIEGVQIEDRRAVFEDVRHNVQD